VARGGRPARARPKSAVKTSIPLTRAPLAEHWLVPVTTCLAALCALPPRPSTLVRRKRPTTAPGRARLPYASRATPSSKTRAEPDDDSQAPQTGARPILVMGSRRDLRNYDRSLGFYRFTSYHGHIGQRINQPTDQVRSTASLSSHSRLCKAVPRILLYLSPSNRRNIVSHVRSVSLFLRWSSNLP